MAPEFANALKLCRGVPGASFIPESKPLLGYRSPPNRLEVPSSWAVVLIEEPPPIVACYTKSILDLGRDEPSFGVTFSPDIKVYLIDPTLSAFRRGINIAYYQLNDQVLQRQGISQVGGAYIGDTFVAPFLFSGNVEDHRCDVVQFISGAICAANAALLTYYGRLVLDRTKIRTTSGVGGV